MGWKQIHGNYSRWGFQHPGPAFFYWEAAWEWMLCDLTGLATAPMGAHHIAIVVLNSALIAMALVLLQRQVRNPAFIPLACVVAAIQFTMINRGLPHAAMLSIWPPYLLFAPFILFVVAGGVLAGGSIRALPFVVGAGGLLVHGHAAHGLFVLPLFFVAAAMWIRHERTAPWKAVGGRNAVVAAAIVLAVFLFPLALDAARGTGSNLYDIWQQLNAPSLQAPRSWFKAFLYLFSFYGYITNQAGLLHVMSDKTGAAFRSAAPALAVWALFHLVLIVFWIWKRRDQSERTKRATIAMLFLALVLSVVWGKVQTGAPENFNAFYVHGLALVAAWLVLGIVVKQLPRTPWTWGLAWAALLLTVAFCRPWLVRSLGTAPKERESIESIARPYVGRTGPVFLSFRSDDWSQAASIALAMVRSGVDVRVGGEWQFMFGRRHALASGKDPEDVLYVQRAGDDGTVETFRRTYGIRHDAPVLNCGANVFGNGGAPLHPFVVSGIQFDGSSEVSPGQAISVSQSARMRFRFPRDARVADVSLIVRSQNNPLTHAGQRAVVFWEGRQVAQAFVDGDARILFSVPLPPDQESRAVDLRIETPDSWQPRELRTSADFRHFGLSLDAIKIRVECGDPGA